MEFHIHDLVEVVTIDEAWHCRLSKRWTRTKSFFRFPTLTGVSRQRELRSSWSPEIVRWDLGQPHMTEHGANGYYRHLERGACRCTIHQHRPISCRGYDCRDDSRIWLDFDNMVVNPRIHDPNWPECLEHDLAPEHDRECRNEERGTNKTA